MCILDILLKSEYTRSIFKLTTGSVIAQGITFLFMLFLTRIFTPSDFGIFSLYISILSFIAIISTGKYDIAIVVSKSEKDAVMLVKISILIAFLVASVAGILVFINSFLPSGFYTDHPVSHWLYLLPLSIFLISLVQIFWMWNVRQKQFGVLNYSRISDAFFAGSVPLSLSFIGPIALLVGHISGQIVSFIFVAVSLIRKNYDLIFDRKIGNLIAAANEYKEFPKVNILQGFLETFQTMGIVLIGSRFLSTAEIGFYALSIRILQIPTGLIIKPISHIFFSEASEIRRSNGNIYSLVKQTIRRTAFIVLPITIIILVSGPYIFSILFGVEWREAGVYAQILSVWFFFDLIRAPIAQVGSVLGKQRKILGFTFLNFIVLLSSLIAGGYFFPDNVYLILYLVSGSQSFVLIFMILYIIKMTKERSI